MIISLRGTSGSGKSHLARLVMGRCRSASAEIQYPETAKRKKPVGQIFLRPPPARALFVPGHYDIANGGIDTLSSIERAYQLIREHHELGMDVMYEGKNMSDGTTRLLGLRDAGADVRVVFLSTSLEECISSVRERGHRIAEKSILKTHEKCRRQLDAFASEGVRTILVSREQALREICEWLEIIKKEV